MGYLNYFQDRTNKGAFQFVGSQRKEVSCGQLSHRNSCRLPPWFSNWKPRNHDCYKSHHHRHVTRHCFCLHLSTLKVLVEHMTCGIVYYGTCNKRKYKIFRKLDHAINNSYIQHMTNFSTSTIQPGI